MSCLRHLGEVASLTKAHRHLLVCYLHVLAHLLCLNHRAAVHSTKYIFETVVDSIWAIEVLVLNRQRFSKLGNARRFSEFIFFTHRSKPRCATLVRELANSHGVTSGWRRRLANEVSVELCVPRGFHFSSDADIRNVAPLGFQGVAPGQRRQAVLARA